MTPDELDKSARLPREAAADLREAVLALDLAIRIITAADVLAGAIHTHMKRCDSYGEKLDGAIGAALRAYREAGK